jgi:predicted exporter
MTSARLVLLTWLAFAVLCAGVVSQTRFDADLSAFLPSSPTPAQKILVEQLREGVVSRLVLIAIEGDSAASLAPISKRLAARLRSHEDFAYINNGEEVGLEKDRAFLWRNRYLLSPAIDQEHFSVASLHTALESNLQLLSSPVGTLLRKVLPADPSGELLRLVEQFEGQAKPMVREGVWFSRDGARTLLIAQTRAAGYDIDAQEKAQAAIRAVFLEASEAKPLRLLMSGPGVFSVNSRASIKGDALRFSIIATSLISAMLLLLYRSPRVLALGLLPVASGALAGVAAVSLGFGSVHGITLGFGVTLIGEGVDYAIYLFTQTVPGTPPQTTLARIWPTLRLGVLTSICGFAAMLFSGFPGLAQLGLFSIVGLVVAVVVTRWVLPPLTPVGFAPASVRTLTLYVMRTLRRAPVLRVPLFMIVALCAIFLVFQREPLLSDSLSSLSPVSARDQLLDQRLRAELGAPDIRYLVVIHAATQEEALVASEHAAAALASSMRSRRIEGFDSPATILPSLKVQRERQSALPQVEQLRANLKQAMQGLPFRDDVFEPFIRDVGITKTAPLLERASLEGTGLAVKFDTLLLKRTSGWTAMLPLRGVTDVAGVARDIGNPPGTQIAVLDLKRESDQLYQTYRDEVLRYSLLGAVVIIILLYFSLRSARRVADVAVPLAAAVIVTIAVLSAVEGRLTLFHLVGMLLVVAVGSNYSLFFEQRVLLSSDSARVMVSLVFAVLSTMIGFGLLTFSSVPVLHAIGSTVACGALLSLVFAAVLNRRAEGGVVHDGERGRDARH